jgi:hypothetical protein
MNSPDLPRLGAFGGGVLAFRLDAEVGLGRASTVSLSMANPVSLATCWT